MLRIAVVESKGENSVGIARMLFDKEKYVIVWECPEEQEIVLDRIRLQSPDVVIVNVSPSRNGGQKVIKAVRREGYDLPVIAVVSSENFQIAADTVKYGLSAMLLKPVDRSALESALDSIALRHADWQQNDVGNDCQKIMPEILRYIGANCNKKLTLMDIGNHFFVSKDHLCKVIKRITGKNFVPLITEIRLNEAKKLLENTKMTIVHLAKETGFQDYTYFCTVFKRHMGVSPSQYRRKMKA